VAEVFIKDLVENNAGLQTTKELILSIAPTDTYVEVGTVSVQAQLQIMGSDDNSFVEADKIRQEELESILRGDSSKAPMSFTEWWAAVRPFRFFRALTAHCHDHFALCTASSETSVHLPKFAVVSKVLKICQNCLRFHAHGTFLGP